MKSLGVTKVGILQLEELVTRKLITRQRHIKYPELSIWNYTPRCQYEKAWDDLTLMCRGLVTDDQGNIVARPFNKFFNFEELIGGDTLLDDFSESIIEEKMDGSLGILFNYKDEWIMATRGSFKSDQAVEAMKILEEKYPEAKSRLDKYFTYLFEIIYPENRIVLDYEGKRDLVLLAVHAPDGKMVNMLDHPFPTPKQYKAANMQEVKALETSNQEGFVLRDDTGFRVKIKFEEYKRLHRLLTETSNIAIWEALKEGKGVQELLDRVPDEFYGWVKSTVKELQGKFEDIHKRTNEAVKEIRENLTFKNPTQTLLMNLDEYEKVSHAMKKALAAHTFEKYLDIQPFIFYKLRGADKQKINQEIWKSIRPKYSKPFKQEI